ncbi:MAG: hypothetical protein R3F56_19135 [Planctomycetota bacterium]
MRLAFVANLDAECEWSRTRYRPSGRRRVDVQARATRVAAALQRCLGVEVVAVDPDSPAPDVARVDGTLCWCPTPRARAAAERAGAPLPAAPADEVLRQVNHRRFAVPLAPPLPGARFVRDMPELETILGAPRPAGGHLLKRPFGFAGRDRKHVAADVPLAGALHTWASASMTEYGCGLQVEPLVRVEREFALHGVVTRRGLVHLGVPTIQVVDEAGAWRESQVAAHGSMGAGEDAELRATGFRVGAALHAAGYFGPFGIDAYRWRDERGEAHFQALSDLNARLTMGLASGLGGQARVLLDEILGVSLDATAAEGTRAGEGAAAPPSHTGPVVADSG